MTSIDGGLWISNNTMLSSLAGLEGLISVGGDVKINSSYNLVGLTGLEVLTSIDGDLVIGSNDVLNSLMGIEGLTSIGGDLIINGNDALISLTGLDNIGSIGGKLKISNNSNLSHCDIVPICEYLSNPPGEVLIYSNAIGCENPPQVASNCGIQLACLPFGSYYFLKQSDIDSFDSLYPGCSDLNGLVLIEGFDEITNLLGLQSITSISGSLLIFSNDSLIDLSGLNNLKSISQDFRVEFNPFLQTLSGLQSLDTIGGLFSIDSNPRLLHFKDLNILRHISGDFTIIFNDSLEDLNGITNLSSIGGNLGIGSNDGVLSLGGVEALNTIGGDLYIGSNSQLSDISQLINLSTIGGHLIIMGNDLLSSLSGLDNISPNSINNLLIRGNDNLISCEVQSICDYLSSPTGSIDIDDNAPGCNSQQEVEDACMVGVPEITEEGKIFVYPNPFTTIEYKLTEPTHIQLSIYNHLGEVVKEAVSAYQLPGVHTYEWSAERLSEGMYFVVLRSGDGVSVVKVIKQ